MVQEHIKSVLSAANTQTCLNDNLRESMRVVARAAADALPGNESETAINNTLLNQESFAARLKILRQDRNITQSDLAELCGWSQSRVGNYENLSREPSFSDINALSRALGVMPAYLLFG